MSDQNEQEKIPCEVCKKHVPRSAALTFEGSDYVIHFCSNECMAEYWKKEHEHEHEKEK